LILSTVVLTTRHVKSVFGYSPSELLALGAIQVIFLGFFHALFAKNMDEFPNTINKGKLDSILLKPIDDQYTVSFFIIRPAIMVRVLIGIGTLMYLSSSGRIEVHSAFNILLFSVLLIASEFLIYSIWFIVATTLIWFPTMENIIELLYNINTTSRYPYEFYREVALTVALFSFPFSIALAIPLKALTGRVTVGEICILLLSTFIFLFLSRRFWKWSLRHYTSASN
jgi:ABC-2 type transport system permease protein